MTEEDGDEIFTPMPPKCLRMVHRWPSIPLIQTCGGEVRVVDGFYVCSDCGVSYGPAGKEEVAS